MNLLFRVLLCMTAAAALCQCSSSKKKKKSKSSELSLAQRATAKPDMQKRSSFEKSLNSNSKSAKGSAGSFYQKQMHLSKEFTGGNKYAGQKQFKTSQSWFGKSKALSKDTTYALGEKQASGMSGKFKTGDSRYSDMQAREGSSAFSGSKSLVKTNSALTRSLSVGKGPKIIENIEANSTKKSAYTEDEVKTLLGR